MISKALNNWQFTTIGESLKLKSGEFLSAANMDTDGKYPVYGGNGINGYHSKFMFKNRVIVLGRVGVYCGVVHYTLPNSWVTDNALYVAEKDPRFIDGYLLLALRHANLNQYASQFGQPLISQSRLNDVKIPLPPLDEQRRIADILSRADRLRRLRRTALELSGGYLQSVFLEMFGDPVENPMGWEIKKTGSQIDSIRYGTGSPPTYQSDGIPFIRATNIKDGGVQKNGLVYISDVDARNIEKCRVSAGDLILVRSGVNTGDCALIPQEYDGAYAAYDLIIEAKFPTNYFLNFIINSEYGKAIIQPISRRSGQPHLNAGQAKSLEFPFPPSSLQQKFAGIVRQVERLRAQQREAQRQAEGLFQALLHRMFNS